MPARRTLKRGPHKLFYNQLIDMERIPMTTYGQNITLALEQLMTTDDRVMLLGEDVCDPYGGAFRLTRGLSSKFPRQVINTPISEAAITGVGIGMALRGLRPIVEIMFGDFVTLIADQVINNAAKLAWMYQDKVTVPLVLRTPMGGHRGYGPTHSQCLEKLFMGVPGLKVICPSCCHDVAGLLETAVLGEQEPVLFVEYKTDYGRQLLRENDGMIGPWFVCKSDDVYPVAHLSPTDFQEDQVTILTYGAISSMVLTAGREVLLEDEIACEVMIPSQIYPLSLARIGESVRRTGRLIIVEEGSRSYGWSSEIIAALSESGIVGLKTPIRRVAAHDVPIGNAAALEAQTLPGVPDIIEAIRGGVMGN